MKKIIGAVLCTSALFASPVHANYTYSPCPAKLCVPGDFSAPGGADFQMDLLAGDFFVDGGQPGSGIGGYALNSLQPIAFHASPFSDPGNTPAGTSTLSYSAINHYTLGTAMVFGQQAEFFLDGPGTGTLVDLDGARGDWSLDIPLFAYWNNELFDFGPVAFGTDAAYGYYPQSGPAAQLAGQSMDYQTGDAFLVGQATVTNPNSSFYGIRVTLGIYGNDPVVAPLATPLPGAALLFGTGLAGLFGVTARSRVGRNAAS